MSIPSRDKFSVSEMVKFQPYLLNTFKDSSFIAHSEAQTPLGLKPKCFSKISLVFSTCFSKSLLHPKSTKRGDIGCAKGVEKAQFEIVLQVFILFENHI